MKRPIAVIGFTVLATLLFASKAGFSACAAVGVLLLPCAGVILFAFRSFRYKRVTVAVLLSAVFALLCYCLAWQLWYEPAAVLDGNRVIMKGTVWDEPQQSNGQYIYNVKSDTFTANKRTIPLKTMVRLRSNQPLGLNAFDHVEIDVELSTPTNGGSGFDSKAYYLSKGVYLFAQPVESPNQNDETSTDAVKNVSTGQRPLYAYAVDLREYISSVIKRSVTGDYGSLAAGILIGDTTDLPVQVKNDFTVCGLSHILAVSGTQTSLICQYLLLALGALGLKKRPRAFITMAAILVFMAVTGFSPSVMRAGIMSLIYLGAMIFGRDSDALNSLGFSVLVLCLLNPFAATDTGLLLSFTATLGMILFSGRFSRALSSCAEKMPAKLRAAFKGPAEILSQTLGASLFTYPVLLLTFRQISTVALLTNLFEVPLSIIVTLLTAVIVLLSPLRILGFIISPMSMLIRVTASIMIWAAHLFASIPFALVSTDYGFVGILFGFALIAGLLYILFRHKGGDIRAVALCFALATSIGFASYIIAERGVMQVAALPVPYGSSTVVCRDGHAIAVDLSGYSSSYELEQFLKAHNIAKLDALILSGYDKERADNANQLISDGKVKNVIIPGCYETARGYKAQYVKAPSKLLLWNDTEIEIVPSKDQKKVAAVVRYGASSVLLTGNESMNGNDYPLEANLLKTDVITFGGSVSDALIKSKSLRYAFAADSQSSTYAAAALQRAGCKVTLAKEDVKSLLTRGNGLYLQR